VNAGTAETNMTRMPYCLSYMRHLEGIQNRLFDRLFDSLVPKYVDIIEHNKMKMVDLGKTLRLQSLKVENGLRSWLLCTVVWAKRLCQVTRSQAVSGIADLTISQQTI